MFNNHFSYFFLNKSIYEVFVEATFSASKISERTEFETPVLGISGPPVLSNLTAAETGLKEKTDMTCPEIPTCSPPMPEEEQNKTLSPSQEPLSVTTASPTDAQNASSAVTQNVSTSSPREFQNLTSPSPTELQNLTSLPATEVQNLTNPSPTEVQNLTSPSPTEVQNLTSLPATEVQNLTNPSPTEVQNLTTPSPTEVQNLTNPSQTEVQNFTSPKPIDVTTAATESENATSVTTVYPTSAAPLELTTETPKNLTHVLTLRVYERNDGPHCLWFVEKGDKEKIKSFTLKVMDEAGQTKFHKTMPKTSRSLLVSNGRGIDRLTFTITATDANGEVIGEDSKLLDLSKTPDEPELIVEANEIRKATTRLSWIVRGKLAPEISYYSLELRFKPTGKPMMKRDLPRALHTVGLKRLRPNRNIYITVTAIGKDPMFSRTVDLMFTTAVGDGEGEPVIVSSSGTLTTASTTTAAMSTTAETEVPSTTTQKSMTENSTDGTAVASTETSPDSREASSAAVTSTEMTPGNTEASSAAVTLTEMTTDTADVSTERAPNSSSAATKTTPPKPCLTINATISKLSNKNEVEIAWNFIQDDRITIKEFLLTLSEQGAWRRTEVFQESLSVLDPWETQLQLKDRSRSYVFELEAIGEDNEVYAKLEKIYLLLYAAEVETMTAYCP
ncbi:hypothetical protein ElyMa_000371800 [Elysia marginata]|uniref:Fibronectin type-III domain-containing protein n=1 Tax=Elysia marginata TaxID=1093978 RepID=A0AAV4FFJ4_9GAST|nr:hypothetical protein ElyMa_000371800 [Elysia marginata]